MTNDRRYYWLKLKDSFFDDKYIKKLRKLAGGDTFTIIYLRIQLLSIRNGGIIEYSGIEKTFAEELALILDEDADNVLVTLNFLAQYGLIETSDNLKYQLPQAIASIGSESASAERVRSHRNAQNAQLLQCNTDVTACNAPVTKCNTEIDIEKEKDLDSELEIESKKANSPKSTMTIPTIEEVEAYCKECRLDINVARFYDFYASKGWMVGPNRMVDWKACARRWTDPRPNTIAAYSNQRNSTNQRSDEWMKKYIKREDEKDEHC